MAFPVLCSGWETGDPGGLPGKWPAIKPEWRVRMVEVAQRFPAWAPLVEHWDELTRMFEAKDPGMFERMKSLGAAL